MWIKGAEYIAESMDIEMVPAHGEEGKVRHWESRKGGSARSPPTRQAKEDMEAVLKNIWQHWALERRRQWTEIVSSVSSTM